MQVKLSTANSLMRSMFSEWKNARSWENLIGRANGKYHNAQRLGHTLKSINNQKSIIAAIVKLDESELKIAIAQSQD